MFRMSTPSAPRSSSALSVEGIGAGPAMFGEVEARGGLEHVRFVIDPVKVDGRGAHSRCPPEPTATGADVDQVPAVLKAVLTMNAWCR